MQINGRDHQGFHAMDAILIQPTGMMSSENRFTLFGIMLQDRPGGAHIGA
jgi:hypothetical protein